MAQTTDIAIPAKTWTMITNSDVGTITFHNEGFYTLKVKGSINTTAPTDDSGALEYSTGKGERGIALSELFPGTAYVRLFVYAGSPTTVSVSHS